MADQLEHRAILMTISLLEVPGNMVRTRNNEKASRLLCRGIGDAVFQWCGVYSNALLKVRLECSVVMGLWTGADPTGTHKVSECLSISRQVAGRSTDPF